MTRFLVFMRSVCALALTLPGASDLLSQSRAPGGTGGIVGAAFDSTFGAPLRGALISVRRADGSSQPFTTHTTASGEYRLVGLSPGIYFVRLEHERLEAIGVVAPDQEADVQSDSIVRVNLAIPSLARVRSLRCGAFPEGASGGVIFGRIRTAVDDRLVSGVQLSASWRDEQRPGAVATARKRMAVVNEATGSFAICFLPVGAQLTIAATAHGYWAVEGPVKLPAIGVLRQNLLLTDSALRDGPARVSGQAATVGGQKLQSGRASIALLDRDVGIVSGRFTISHVPFGTWTIRVRAIGVEPQEMLVNIERADTDVSMQLITSPAQSIDTVRVLAEQSRVEVLLQQIRARKRTAFGTVFLPDHPAFRMATHTADVLREARGFWYQNPTTIRARPVISNKEARRCDDIAVYVNGMILPGGFAGLDLMAPVSEVLAVEAYPDVLFAPIQFRGNVGVDYERAKSRKATSTGVCAVVLVWTKHPF